MRCFDQMFEETPSFQAWELMVHGATRRNRPESKFSAAILVFRTRRIVVLQNYQLLNIGRGIHWKFFLLVLFFSVLQYYFTWLSGEFDFPKNNWQVSWKSFALYSFCGSVSVLPLYLIWYVLSLRLVCPTLYTYHFFIFHYHFLMLWHIQRLKLIALPWE